MVRVALVTAVALMMTACSLFSPTDSTIATGTWSGDHVVLAVTSTGAQVTFDCAHGVIPDPMTLDSRQQFDVKGSYTSEAGPTPQTEPSKPARYSGGLAGNTLALSVVLTDSNQTIGVFALTLGRAPSLVKCR